MKKTLYSLENKLLVEKLIEMRKKAGFLNQRDFAKAAGMSKSTIGNIEIGNRRIDLVEFYRFCKICNVNPLNEISKLISEFDTLRSETRL